MAEPTLPSGLPGPRVAEGLVATDGSAGWKRGANPVAVTGSAYVALEQVVAPLTVGILQTVTTLTTEDTAYHVPATALTGRRTLVIQAPRTNTASIFIGSATVTADHAATGGAELLPGETMSLDVSAGVVVHAISAVAAQKITSLEGA
jgi:hypothetical protein